MFLTRFPLTRLGLGAGLVLSLAACASIPAPLAGEFAEFQPDQATERSVGAQVRWGGTIVDTRPGRSETCIEILAQTLDRDLRPRGGDVHHGRFLACRDGFRDPAVFTSGRDITVVGRLDDFVEDEIGDFVYRYPRLSAEVLYLWPMRPDIVYAHGPYPRRHGWPYYDPWWHYGPPRSRVSGSVIIVR